MNKTYNKYRKIISVSDISSNELEFIIYAANLLGFFEGGSDGSRFCIDDKYLLDFCVKAYEEKKKMLEKGKIFSLEDFVLEYYKPVL